MALGISLRDQQNFQPPEVTAVIPPVSSAEVAAENVLAPFKGVAAGAAQTYETARALGSNFGALGGYVPEMDIGVAESPEDQQRRFAIDSAQVVNSLRPDPRKSGAAAQTLHGLTSGLTRFVGGTALAGPVGGALTVGLTEGTTTRNELIANGVDPDTAGKLGVGSALFSGAASLLPGGYGQSLAARLLSGSAAQVSLGAVQRGMMSNVLAQNGYAEQARQYEPLDGASLMADAVLGAAFGAVHHVFAPDAVDSAHAIKDTQQVERSAPGPAVDPVSRNSAVDAVERTLASQIRGEDTPPPTNDVRYVPDDVQNALREATGREAQDAAAEIGAGRVEDLDAFHGTNAAFEHYSIEQNLGPHFGDAEQANLYTSREAGGGGGNIRPVVLNFDNAVRVPHLHWENPVILAGQLRDLGIIPPEVIERLKGGPENRTADFSILRKTLLDKGVDSFVYKDKFDNSKSDSYIALKPAEQVKSKFESSSLSRAGRAQARAKAEGEAVAQLDPATAEAVQQALAIIKAREGATIPSAESPDKDIDAAGALKRALDDIKNAQGDEELHRVAAACLARA